MSWFFPCKEGATKGVLKKAVLKISQYPQGNTCAKVCGGGGSCDTQRNKKLCKGSNMWVGILCTRGSTKSLFTKSILAVLSPLEWKLEVVAQRCFVKKVKYLCQSLLFKKGCNFIKKETLAQVFSCKFCEISKNTYLQNISWRLTASCFDLPLNVSY